MSSAQLRPLVIRADASTQIGTGHVMRCLALAQAWQDAGGTAHFVAADLPEGLAARLAAEDMVLHRLDVAPGSCEDAAQTTALAHALGVAWAVEDGYHLGMDYQKTIKDSGLRLLAIDDYGHAGHYVADLVLNQNIGADPSLYLSRAPSTRLLLGTEYVLLRREFLRWRGWQRKIPKVAHRVLVTMGGGDPDDVTLKVIEALEHVKVAALQVVVVAGASNPHLSTLQFAAQRSPHAVRIAHNVTDMPELMAWADVAVTAAGSTCWELAFMGVSTICLSLAENQTAIAAGLDDAGAALNLGWHASLKASNIARPLAELLLSPAKRQSMTRHGQEQVNGQGAIRVSRLLGRNELSLRSVRPEVRQLIWEWANDPDVRAHSFSPDSIPWEQHVAWFEKRLDDSLTHFYVAVDADGNPVGQIRFQVEAEAATVSVSLAPGQRGKGYGTEVIHLGTQQIWATTKVMKIHAYIKSGNDASIRAFSRAGYVSAGAVMVHDCLALHFLIRRPQSHAASV